MKLEEEKYENDQGNQSNMFIGTHEVKIKKNCGFTQLFLKLSENYEKIKLICEF